MCSFIAKLCDFIPDSLEVGAFSSALEVGIGLYVGLAAVQIVSEGGMATLRRRTMRLQEAIDFNSMADEEQRLRRIRRRIATAELGTQRIGKFLISGVFALLVTALLGLAFATVSSTTPIGCLGGIGLLFFYLALPLLLFALASFMVRRQYSGALTDIAACEVRVLNAAGSQKATLSHDDHE